MSDPNLNGRKDEELDKFIANYSLDRLAQSFARLLIGTKTYEKSYIVTKIIDNCCNDAEKANLMRQLIPGLELSTAFSLESSVKKNKKRTVTKKKIRSKSRTELEMKISDLRESLIQKAKDEKLADKTANGFSKAHPDDSDVKLLSECLTNLKALKTKENPQRLVDHKGQIDRQKTNKSKKGAKE